MRVAPWGSPFWRLGERWREGFVLHLRNQTSILAAPVRAPQTEVPLAVCPAAGRQVATPPRLVSAQFEGSRSAGQIQKFWQNWEHPSVNKQEWSGQEVRQLKALAAQHGHLEWQRVAEELGVRRGPPRP